jgi:hypothetical protein
MVNEYGQKEEEEMNVYVPEEEKLRKNEWNIRIQEWGREQGELV